MTPTPINTQVCAIIDAIEAVANDLRAHCKQSNEALIQLLRAMWPEARDQAGCQGPRPDEQGGR